MGGYEWQQDGRFPGRSVPVQATLNEIANVGTRTRHMAKGQVVRLVLADGSVVTAKIADNAVDADTKIYQPVPQSTNFLRNGRFTSATGWTVTLGTAATVAYNEPALPYTNSAAKVTIASTTAQSVSTWVQSWGYSDLGGMFFADGADRRISASIGYFSGVFTATTPVEFFLRYRIEYIDSGSVVQYTKQDELRIFFRDAFGTQGGISTGIVSVTGDPINAHLISGTVRYTVELEKTASSAGADGEVFFSWAQLESGPRRTYYRESPASA